MKKKTLKKWKGIVGIGFGLAVAAGLGVLYWKIPDNRPWQYVILEAGAPLPQPEDFLIKQAKAETSFVSDISSIDTKVPGDYTVELASGRFQYSSVLQIRDTVSPLGGVKELTLSVGETCVPTDFLEWAWDATDLTLTYAYGGPDFNQAGDQPVTLVLTDVGGQETRLNTVLHLIADTTPPVITGVQDQTVYVGDTISYKHGVTVTDDKDTDVELVVDNSGVDLETPGTYTVVYLATDAAGNQTTATAEIRVLPKDTDMASYEKKIELADEALAECWDSTDSEVEQLRSIYNYVRENMSYTGDSDKNNETGEAIRGFTEGVGDCFTYFAMLKVMMEEAGFETLDVQRVGGSTHHFWSLVQVEGEWYHIDACPRSHYSEWLCFLRSDSEVEAFSKMWKKYYNFDHEDLPATPEHGLGTDPAGWEYDDD